MIEDPSRPDCDKAGRAGSRILPWLTLVLLAIPVTLLVLPLLPNGGTTADAQPAPPPQPDPNTEPIAYIGHGAFFDHNGKQIVPTAEFVAQAQRWYRQRLLAGVKSDQRAEFTAFEKRLSANLNPDGQAKLVLQQRSLDWLLARTPLTPADGRMRAKLNALSYRLKWRLARRNDPAELRNLVRFRLDPAIEARLKRQEFKPGGGISFLTTTNSGQAYLDECAAAGVPIPPSIGVLNATSWQSRGFIPQAEQFIVGTPAEVRVFENPAGTCIALPRYSDNTLTEVSLDGVICLSRTTSKVCFWDNQMGGNGFEFPAGAQIPIGVPNLAVNPAGLYQAGGAELEFGAGGVCTDCHAGENPYIIHPDSDLGAGTFMADVSVFGPDRYDPIVGASWPQNQLSHSAPLVPSACSACHTQGDAGRFPHLSSELPGYCNTILAQAVNETMPLGAPGSAAGSAEVVAFRNWCSSAPTSGPSDRGDPHLTTTNGVDYDFQAAGEFVSLRNSATGFELQTRQTPVLTSFTPGANAHTGLASCVSLNTAAALRVGRSRVTYQPDPANRERMQLRVDGKLVALSANGLNLSPGNRIIPAAAGGGLDVRLADGTRVILSPHFWDSEGYWYLNVEVLNTPAREGTMGHIQKPDWLPRAPNGSSFGPKPAGLATRHLVLNKAFANAWRVTDTTSLFDYEPGTSTASFTERSWPPPSGAPCRTIRSNPWPGGEPRKPVKPATPEKAREVCRPLQQDKIAFQHCFFDVLATGHEGFAKAYQRSLELRSTP